MNRNQDKMNMRGQKLPNQQKMSDSLDDDMMQGNMQNMQSMQGKNMNMNKKGQNKMSMNKPGMQSMDDESMMMHGQDNCDNTQHKHNKNQQNKQRDAAPSFVKSAAANAENLDDDIQRQSQWGRN